MPKIAEDFQTNVQTIIHSHLTIKKKQHILESISEQLTVLCNQQLVPDLTDQERKALQQVNAQTQKAVHKLTNFK